MDAAQWNRIEEIYSLVLPRPAGQRTALLDDLCGPDLQLRREVESLLEADAAADSFLGQADLEAQITHLAAESAPRPVGSILGHYQILSQIAAGGMGEVYLATDQHLNRLVALKVLPAGLTQDARRVRWLLREARVASALNHPNIITVYEIGTAEGSHFIASEFIDGSTVRHLMKSGIALPSAIRIALQAASALDAAHKSGVTHRDIKPENIMVRPDGLAKVLDFGLALLVAESISSTSSVLIKTEPGMVMGTPRYMSPEQARGEKLDHRSDIFSLGAVLYEMAAGAPPFPGQTTAEVFAQLLGADPKPLSAFCRGLPGSLAPIIRKAMAKDREKRYGTMAEFSADLEALQGSLQKARRGTSEARKQTPLGTASNVSSLRKRIGRQVYTYGLVAAAGFAVAALLFGTWRGNRSITPASLHIAPLATFEGEKNHAAFSPDGSHIAFAWDGGKPGMRDIYIKVVGAGDPLRITSAPEDDWLPAWSPDGRFIAFSRTIGGKQSAYLVPALGGQETKIADAGIGFSWLPDSRSLAIALPLAPQDNGGLAILSLDSGERRQLTTPSPYADSLPAASPDGQWVAFIRSLTPSAREVFVVPARGGAARQITFDKRPVWGVTWTPDSRNIIFSCNHGGGESLWRIPPAGGDPERIIPGLMSAFYPNMARAANRLLFTEEFNDTNVYRFTGSGFGKDGVPGQFSAPQALVVSSREDGSPAFSPDGKRLAFVSKRTGTEEIWLGDSDGGRLVQLTSFSGSATGSPKWSPDGKWIAFDTREAGSPDIYVIAAEGGAPRRLTTEPSADVEPSWSHDGKWIYFISNRTGSDEIWKMPSAGGPSVQVSHTGAREALEGPQGDRVYFVKSRAWGIWSVKLDGSDEAIVPGLENSGRSRLWGVHPKGIYFVSKDAGPPHKAEWYSFATRKVSTLFTFDKEPMWNGPGLVLSPDGRQLLLVLLDQHINDLMMIEGLQ